MNAAASAESQAAGGMIAAGVALMRLA